MKKVHTVFVEPANYTRDLILNVHKPLGITYSFISSESLAGQENDIVQGAEHIYSQLSIFRWIKSLWQISKSNKLIIVNGYSHYVFILVWLFSKVHRTYIGIESDTPYKEVSSIKGLVKKLALRILFSGKRIIGLPGGESEAHKELFTNYGMAADRVFTLPMMVNNSIYCFMPAEEKFNNFPKLIFLFVGRLDPEKNVSFLVNSFKKLALQNPDIELWIVGAGSCSAEIALLAEGNSHIKLHGKLFGSQLIEVYRKAHVLVLPSYFEPWGLVVNEALAAGLAVICSSAVGAATDLVINPNAGWVFDNNNGQQLEEIMLNCIQNPDDCKDKAIKGQHFMIKKWNYNMYITALNRILDYVGAS